MKTKTLIPKHFVSEWSGASIDPDDPAMGRLYFHVGEVQYSFSVPRRDFEMLARAMERELTKAPIRVRRPSASKT